MSQKYRKKPRRSSRKQIRQPEGEVLGIDDASVQLSLPIAEILAGAHDAVEAVAGQAGLLVMQAIIDQEVKDLTGGDRHARSKERRAFRWGHEDGFVVFAGQKLPLRRPRVRGLDNKEMSRSCSMDPRRCARACARSSATTPSCSDASFTKSRTSSATCPRSTRRWPGRGCGLLGA